MRGLLYCAVNHASHAQYAQWQSGGEYCANLDPDSLSCRIWGQADYPEFCRGFLPEADFCGESRQDALQILTLMEADTQAQKP